MNTPLGYDYFFFAFFAVLGALQIAFAVNGLYGLLFIRKSPRACALIGAMVVIAAFLWFFLTGDRHVPDKAGGLDGNRQALTFIRACVGAFAFTLLTSSLVNYRWGREAAADPQPGLRAMERTTYMQALAATLLRSWRGR